MAIYNTHKEVVEEIVKKYKDIDKRSRTSEQGCFYSGLNTNGVGCFIGCVIPDEQVKIELDSIEEFGAIDNIYKEIHKEKPTNLTAYVFEEVFNMNNIDISFLIKLQQLHDYNPINDAKTELNNLLENMEG